MSTMKLLLGLRASKVNANLIGTFGSGKSSIVYQMGEKCKCKVVVKSLNKMDTTDFSGVPYLSDELGVEYDREGNVVTGSDGKPKLIRKLKTSPSPFIRDLLENPNAILFLDEINRASPALQSAALTLIQDGDAGDTKIADTVWRVAAMNEFDIGVNAFSKAAANRFCHIYHNVDVEHFCKGFVTGFMEDDAPIINSEEEVIKNRLKYRQLLVKFLKDNPNMLPNEAPDELVGEFAFPTSRTWEMVTEILAHLDKNDNEYLKTLINGCVGKAAGTLFFKAYSDDNFKMIDITEYLGKEETFRLPNPNRPDESYSIIQSLQYWFNIDPVKYFNLWKAIIKLLHNKDKKYGNYANSDNLIMNYLVKNTSVIWSKVFKTDIEFKMETLRSEMDGVFDLLSVGMISGGN